MSALNIFDARKFPKVDSPDLPQYGEQAITTLLAHYGAQKPAETLLGEPTSANTTVWKIYHQLLVNKPENNMKSHLKKIASISFSMPVSTASVEMSFSQMKLIKTRLQSLLNNKSLSHLMKSLLSPQLN